MNIPSPYQKVHMNLLTRTLPSSLNTNKLPKSETEQRMKNMTRYYEQTKYRSDIL